MSNIALDKKHSTRELLPSDVARYFLVRAADDGELISPLKMQKLVYYAYVWHLIEKRHRLFKEGVEAWPMGPVVSSLYHELKRYGAGPIAQDYLGIDKKKNVNKLLEKISESKAVLDRVYEKYDSFTAFELVMLTHSEKPWLIAREGLTPEHPSVVEISDKDILEYYKGKNL